MVTAGAHLITAPPTPVLHSSLTDPDATFATQLQKSLKRYLWSQTLRRNIYGDDVADEYRMGHTPADVWMEARAELWNPTCDSSDDDSETESASPKVGSRPLDAHSNGKRGRQCLMWLRDGGTLDPQTPQSTSTAVTDLEQSGGETRKSQPSSPLSMSSTKLLLPAKETGVDFPEEPAMKKRKSDDDNPVGCGDGDIVYSCVAKKKRLC